MHLIKSDSHTVIKQSNGIVGSKEKKQKKKKRLHTGTKTKVATQISIF